MAPSIIRGVAAARLAARGIEDLPWWRSARNRDEIAAPDEHPEAETFDGRAIDDDRVSCTLPGFIELFERFAGCRIEDLASPLKAEVLVHGRVELTLLGISRYGLSSSDLARIIGKHPSSMSRWLTEGLARERGDHTFRDRIRHLDRQISAAALRNE